uniref:Uncharacterized protein n=1 Tax=Erpetoichthys calabaricus TaxID=27687 RepID=A0A8C4SYZ8_ERPCA
MTHVYQRGDGESPVIADISTAWLFSVTNEDQHTENKENCQPDLSNNGGVNITSKARHHAKIQRNSGTNENRSN